MRSFSATDLGNKTGDVLATASQEPIAISKHGKPRFVILTSETFNKLKRGSDPRVAGRTADIPPEIGSAIIASIEEMMREDE